MTWVALGHFYMIGTFYASLMGIPIARNKVDCEKVILILAKFE